WPSRLDVKRSVRPSGDQTGDSSHDSATAATGTGSPPAGSIRTMSRSVPDRSMANAIFDGRGSSFGPQPAARSARRSARKFLAIRGLIIRRRRAGGYFFGGSSGRGGTGPGIALRPQFRVTSDQRSQKSLPGS